jgi:23S rRNA pseudouridine1911/1915/1917 synthase
MERQRGTFRSFLVTDPDLNRRSTRRPGKGELAITHFEVVSSNRDATVVRVQLETGRRNQIRVHFAEAGHPVLGDPRYGSDQSHDRRWKARRLALHALSLEVEHPATGKKMRFETELPKEFSRFVTEGGGDKKHGTARNASHRRT